MDRDLSEDRDKALLASRASRISSDRLEAGAASVTFLRNSRKCLEVANRVADEAALATSNNKDRRVQISHLMWRSIFWTRSMVQPRRFNTSERTRAKLVMAQVQSLALNQ